MMHDIESRSSLATEAPAAGASPGRQSLSAALAPPRDAEAEPAGQGPILLPDGLRQRSQVQRKAQPGPAAPPEDVQEQAAFGVEQASDALPHGAAIQRAFGHHDVSGVRAQVGGRGAAAAQSIGARAYATGDRVAFAQAPDLHTAAHEAAHVVQQQAGVQLKAEVGEAGDSYERHADAVADAVVRGESAQGQLDQMTGGAAMRGGGAGRAVQGKAVQRLVGPELATAHLGARDRGWVAAPVGAPAPNPGHQVFSGDLRAEFDFRVQMGSTLQQAIDAARPSHGAGRDGGEPLPGGTVGGNTADSLRAAHPELAEATLASARVVAGATRRALSRTVVEGVPELQGNRPQASLLDDFGYPRGAASEPLTLTAQAPAPNIGTLSNTRFRLSGTHRLETAGDGGYLAQLTSQRLNPPWTALLQSQPESEGFKQMFLAQHASDAAKRAWYQWARTGIFGGTSARDFIVATIQQEAVHVNMVRALQHFIVAGVPGANADLMAYVDATRSLIREPGTAANVCTILQNRVVNSYFWGELRVTAADFPDNPGAVPDAPTPPGTGAGSAPPDGNAQFELVRLAGDVLAARGFLPTVQSSLDPVTFIQRYPDSEEATPASDLMDQTIAEANAIKRRTRAFLDGITPEQLGPAAFNLGGPTDGSPGPHAGLDATNQRMAVEAGRVGAAQRISEGVSTNAARDFNKRLGVHLAMTELAAAAAAPRRGMPMTLQLVANRSAAALGTRVEVDSRELVRAGERLAHRRSGSDSDRQHGQDLINFANLFINYSQSHDLAALRGQLGGTTVSLAREGNINLLRSHLSNQAAIGVSNAINAFEHAFTRARQSMIEDIRGLINERRGGATWVSVGGNLWNLATNVLDLVNNLRVMALGPTGQATMGMLRLAAVQPGMAVVGVVVGGIISVYNWYASGVLQDGERDIIAAAERGLTRLRSQTLARAQTAANTERGNYAAGRVRQADGFRAYLRGLSQDHAGSPGDTVDLNTLDTAAIAALYEGAVSSEDVPYNSFYMSQAAAIHTRGEAMMTDFRRQIAAMPSTL